MTRKQIGTFWLILLFNFTAGSGYAAVELNGVLIQGSLLRGQAPAGSEVRLNGEAIPVAKNGEFVIGFGREEALSHTLTWQSPGDSWQTYPIAIDKREYRIQRIDGLEQSKVTPPESVLNRIRDDARRVRSARSPISELSGFDETFIWPSEGIITGVYGSQRILNGTPSRPHYGIDLAAPTGTVVVAPASGRITMADPDLYYSGGTMIIDHGLGVFSTFLHLSELSVKVGDMVEQGQKIGEIGASGRATGPHLDWRINWRTVRLDPALLVPAKEGLDYTSQSD